MQSRNDLTWIDLENDGFQWKADLNEVELRLAKKSELFLKTPKPHRYFEIVGENLGKIGHLSSLRIEDPHGFNIIMDTKFLTPCRKFALQRITLFLEIEYSDKFDHCLRSLFYLNNLKYIGLSLLPPVEKRLKFRRSMLSLSKSTTEDIFVTYWMVSAEAVLHFQQCK